MRRGVGLPIMPSLSSMPPAWIGRQALDHLRRSLRTESENLNARNLKVMVLRELGKTAEADALLQETRALDRLDTWSRYLESGAAPADGQQILDLSFDLARAGFNAEALKVLSSADLASADGSVPVILYLKALLYAELGDQSLSAETYRQAAVADPAYCFPSRLEEMLVLERAISANPEDCACSVFPGQPALRPATARRRNLPVGGIGTAWSREFATVWRNLGIAYFNVRHEQAKALDAFDRAHSVDANDARILYERDQLWKRVGKSPEERLETLQRRPDLTFLRDDLAVEFATLLNQTGKPEKALHLLTSRIFQPWEGGEGLVLAQFVRCNLLLGRRALTQNDPIQARRFFEAVLTPPHNLGEAKHLLANWSDVFFWIGVSYADEDRSSEATHAWQLAVRQHGDFQQMSVRSDFRHDLLDRHGLCPAWAREKSSRNLSKHLRLLSANATADSQDRLLCHLSPNHAVV